MADRITIKILGAKGLSWIANKVLKKNLTNKQTNKQTSAPINYFQIKPYFPVDSFSLFSLPFLFIENLLAFWGENLCESLQELNNLRYVENLKCFALRHENAFKDVG